MNEHAIYETVGAKRQRLVFMFSIWSKPLIGRLLQTFYERITKTVLSGNCWTR